MVDMYGYLTAVHRFQAAAKAKGQDKAVQAEANEDERALAVLRLVDHLREAGKPHMASKYLLLLAGWQEELGNTAEAGMVVGDLARSLGWSEQLVPAAAAGAELYPVEPARVRREKLYRRAAALLEQGGALEEAAAVLRELGMYLREEAYRYAELGVLLRREATLFDTMNGLSRMPCTFFLVTPYGGVAAASVGSAPLVFKGQQLERASSFAERLARKFPAATILRQPKVDVEALRKAEGVTLHVLPLTPVPGACLDHVLAAHEHGQDVSADVQRDRAAYNKHLQRLRRMPPPQTAFYRHTRCVARAVPLSVHARLTTSAIRWCRRAECACSRCSGRCGSASPRATMSSSCVARPGRGDGRRCAVPAGVTAIHLPPPPPVAAPRRTCGWSCDTWRWRTSSPRSRGGRRWCGRKRLR